MGDEHNKHTFGIKRWSDREQQFWATATREPDTRVGIEASNYIRPCLYVIKRIPDRIRRRPKLVTDSAERMISHRTKAFPAFNRQKRAWVSCPLDWFPWPDGPL